MANFNIGGIYLAQNNTSKALEYHEKALAFFKSQNDLEKQAIALSAIGGDYVSIKDYDKAIGYFEQSKDISLSTGNNRQLAFVYDYLADLNSKKSNYEKALEYSFLATPIWKELAPGGQNAIVNKGNIGGAYLDLAINDSLTQKRHPGNSSFSRKELLASAEKHLKETISMSQTINDLYYESFYGLILSDVYELQSDYKNAYSLYKNIKPLMIHFIHRISRTRLPNWRVKKSSHYEIKN
ncbi:MAG: tetratricopeptide repeat protein [Chitinophagaceae bacterium]|nr:tetratricopeptide repeat protein [Chitinophagaceae bacterium]